MSGDVTTTFEFDRPSQHGLGPKTYGEGAADNAEAVEAVADRMRDEVLRHLDPADMAGDAARMA